MSELFDRPRVFRIQGLDEAPEVCPWIEGEIGIFSSRSPAKESPNEDAALAVELGQAASLLAVADGCGGMPRGAEAAHVAVQALAATCAAEWTTAGEIGAALAGFDAANQAVLGLQAGAGTTLVAVLVLDRVARVLHAGDSTALICGQRGALHYQSVSHSPTGYGLEAGILSEPEALGHEDRSLISNFVGTPDMRVEISPPVRLAARDTILLASDGLADNALGVEIVDAVRSGRLEPSLAALVSRVRARMRQPADGLGHPDDLTLLAYRPTVVG